MEELHEEYSAKLYNNQYLLLSIRKKLAQAYTKKGETHLQVKKSTSCGPERESLSCASHLGVSTSNNYPFMDGNHYPIAKVLICSCFLLILLVEAVVYKCCGHAHDEAGVVQLDLKGETWEGRRFYKDGPWILFNTISTFNIRLN